MGTTLITPDLAPLFVDRLFHAAQQGDIEEIRVLLEAGMDVNTHHPQHTRTILMEATRNRHTALVSHLLEQGANANICDLLGQLTPLHFAIEHLHEDSLHMLLAAGARTDIATKRGMQPLHLLCIRERLPSERMTGMRMVERLIKAEAPLNALDGDDTAPLHYCAAMDNRLCAQKLLQAGANPNIQTTQHGITPLHIAMLEKNFGFADLLYAYGADDTLANHAGKTPEQLVSGKRPGYQPPECTNAQELQVILQRILPTEAMQH